MTKEHVEENKDVEEFVSPVVKKKENVKSNTSPKVVDVFAPTQIILEGETIKPNSTAALSPLLNNSTERKDEDNKQLDDINSTHKIKEDESVASNIISPVVEKLSKTSWSLVSDSVRSPQRVE